MADSRAGKAKDNWVGKTKCKGSGKEPLGISERDNTGLCDWCRRRLALHRDGTLRPHMAKPKKKGREWWS